MNKEDVERLEDIRAEMMDLLDEAKNIIRQSGNKSVYERAKAYWIGHIDSGLGGGDYVDTYDYTFEKTIKELQNETQENEEEDDNEHENNGEEVG